MKMCRDAMIDVARNYPSRHPIAREADWLVKDIDNLAGIITGKHSSGTAIICARWCYSEYGHK